MAGTAVAAAVEWQQVDADGLAWRSPNVPVHLLLL